jgi:hypothetical protein
MRSRKLSNDLVIDISLFFSGETSMSERFSESRGLIRSNVAPP